MNTSDFIYRAWNGQTRSKRCVSVFIEGTGDKKALYSYGYHYPLLFDEEILTKLIEGQTQYAEGIQEQMDAKKRKDTQVYKYLQIRHAEAVCNLERLQLI